MKSGIYKITCEPTKKVYIGQSKDVQSRFKYHMYDLKRGKHGNPYFMHAYQKYGKDCFSFEVLEFCEEEKLDEREIHYIAFYNSCDEEFGYNILNSPWWRDAIKARWADPEFRKKREEDQANLWKDPEFRARNEAAIKKAHEERKARGEILGCLSEEGKAKSKAACSTPEHRQLRSDLAYKQLEDPKYREENLKRLEEARKSPVKAQKLKEFNEKQKVHEDHKKKQASHAKNGWADPVKRAARIAAIKKAVNTPENRKKKSEQMKKQMQDPKMQAIVKTHNDRQKGLIP
jgi:group I intron endonuclease